METCEKLWRTYCNSHKIHITSGNRKYVLAEIQPQAFIEPQSKSEHNVICVTAGCVKVKYAKSRELKSPYSHGFSTCFLPFFSISPTNVQQNMFKSDLFVSLQTKKSSYSLHYTIIFPSISHWCYWKQILSELCQYKEQHKNLCFLLVGALGRLGNGASHHVRGAGEEKCCFTVTTPWPGE